MLTQYSTNIMKAKDKIKDVQISKMSVRIVYMKNTRHVALEWITFVPILIIMDMNVSEINVCHGWMKQRKCNTNYQRRK